MKCDHVNCLDVGFFLNGVLYPNNSVVVLADIGEGPAALYCLTNLTTCCEDGSAGEWFLPGETQPVVAGNAGSANFTVGRAPSAVFLNRRDNVGGSTGIYTCRVPDESGQVRTAYIGVDTGTCIFHVTCR